MHLLVVQKSSRCSYGDVETGARDSRGVYMGVLGLSCCSLRAGIPENCVFSMEKDSVKHRTSARRYLQQLTRTLNVLSCLWIHLDVEMLSLDNLMGWICISVLAPTMHPPIVWPKQILQFP